MRTTPRSAFVAAAAMALGLGAGGAVSAGTDTTEPTDVAAFCEAELAAEAAAASEDPATMGPAFETLAAAAPEDIAATVEEVIAIAEAGTENPEFAAAYSAMVEYVAANCGFAELGVAASDYAFGGIPEELAAGPTVINLVNIGEEVHEIAIYRINDDVTLTVEDILALPDEEVASMVTFLGETFAFPGESGYKVVDLTVGRHVALCFIPEGTIPELFEEMVAEEEEHEMLGGTMAAEGTMPADETAPGEETTPVEGTVADGGEEPPPHWTLGMIQEFTVV